MQKRNRADYFAGGNNRGTNEQKSAMTTVVQDVSDIFCHPADSTEKLTPEVNENCVGIKDDTSPQEMEENQKYSKSEMTCHVCQ